MFQMKRAGFGVRLALCFLFVVASACDSVLYYPTHDVVNKPEDSGATVENIWFQNEEGAKLHGVYFRHLNTSRPARAVFVFFHGNGSNLTGHFPHLIWTLKQDFDFFIFDYQGYGESPGEPTPKGTLLDGKAAVRYVASRYPELPLIIFGQSLGGAVAMRTVIELKDEIKPGLIIVDSSFISYREVARNIVSRYGLGSVLSIFLPSDEFAPVDRVAEIAPIPMLIYHGNLDQIVDYKFGLQIFEKAGSSKEFWTVFSGQHTDAFSKRHNGIYKQALLDFLSRMKL